MHQKCDDEEEEEDDADDIQQQINQSQNEPPQQKVDVKTQLLSHFNMTERDNEQMGAAGALASIGLMLENRGFMKEEKVQRFFFFLDTNV